MVTKRDRKVLETYKSEELDALDKRMKNDDDPINIEELKDIQDAFPDLPKLETIKMDLGASKSATHTLPESTARNIGAQDQSESLTSMFGSKHDGIELDLSEIEVFEHQATEANPAPKV